MRRLLLIGLFVVGLFWAVLSYPGLAIQGDYQSIVLDFREDLPVAEIDQEVKAIAQRFGVAPRLNSVFSETDHVYVVEGSAETLRSLRHSNLRRYTESIDPNYIYRASEIPNDPEYGKQWNFRSINIESAWDQTKGKGATVAVIDTGVSVVPDLKNTKMVEGYDFVNDRTDAADDVGHGTHVAGTIAQSTNNNYGVAGIAYEAALMPIKVLGFGGGTVADIAEGIRFAADHGADVINMSLGGGGDSHVLREAIDYAARKGVVLVAAAGNAGRNAAEYPARYPNVIAVSALDASGAKTAYSNFGAGVDISAPGGAKTNGNEAGGILQDTIDPDTGESRLMSLQGTSMAAPHVAGVAALIKSLGVKDPAEVTALLQRSARQIQDDQLNHFGAGQLDALAAVKLAKQGNLDLWDFLRWLRDNGYLNLKFWFDGGVVALVPKIVVVLGSYLLAWILRTYLPLWGLPLGCGLVAGSSGLFFLKGFYIFDLPQFPFRILGSSIPELGGAIQGSGWLNPVFASVLIPFALIALLLSHAKLKWFAIGSALGVAACLGVSAVWDPAVLWLGDGTVARLFLGINALLCFGLATLAAKAAKSPQSLA